jgi:hypothetical protein
MVNQTVITEEYVAKVIIEAKWGTNEGEFGRNFLGMGTKDYKPSSLAVNSKGEIYILDLVNNRIQKFDKDGKYLKNIWVESFKGWEEYEEVGIPVDPKNPEGEIIDKVVKYIHPTETLGINLVIDSEDNLYYYCQKDLMKKNESGEWIKNPEAKGEVWLFKNDKLVRKWETNVMERFEPEPDYKVEKQKIDKDKEKVIIKFKDGRRMEKEVKGKYGKDYGNPIFLKNSGELLIPIHDNDLTGHIFDSKGKLKKIITNLFLRSGRFFGNDINIYEIQNNSNGIKIIKYERQPIKK